MTESYMAIEWAIAVGIASLLIGFGLAFVIWGGKGSSRKRVNELEEQLESSQDELAEYRKEVFGQFSETADKFRALDKSYHDLHRQLAASSVALIGDQASPLLIGESVEADEQSSGEEIVVDEHGAAVEEEIVATVDEASDEVVEEAAEIVEEAGEVASEAVADEAVVVGEDAVVELGDEAADPKGDVKAG